jgi:SGNH hydrolase-like domain, acetyltransferase AlgX
MSFGASSPGAAGMTKGGRRGREAAILVFASGLYWAATAWLARDLRPWAIRLTDVAIAVGLVLTYVSVWYSVAVWRRAGRATAVRAIATTLVGLVLLSLLEVPALFHRLDYAQVLSTILGEWRGPATAFVTDPELVYHRPPHEFWSGRPRSDMAMVWNLPIRARKRQVFTTDARGFRNRREMTRADVALVGDSFVEGAYVSDEETCATALEGLLEAPVANLGQSGYGTLQELKVIEKVALPLQPRTLVWFFFEGNDLYDDEAYENALAYYKSHGTLASPPSWAPDFPHLATASFTVSAFRLFRRLADPLFPNEVSSVGWFPAAGDAPRQLYFYGDAALHWGDFERDRFEKTKAAFVHGRDLSAAQGTRLLVVFIPTKFRVYGDYCRFPPGSPCPSWRPWRLPEELAAFCRREKIELLDLTEPMRRAAAAGKLLYAAEDSHWSAEGHRFVAGLIADECRAMKNVR